MRWRCIGKLLSAFEQLFGRRYDVIEGYRLDDAEDVLVMTNAFASKGKAAVDAARAEGRRVGLLRLRVIRPWPADAIRRALRGRRAVAVLDQNLSPGQGGILFQEIAACLYHEAAAAAGALFLYRRSREERIFRKGSFAPSSSRRQKPESEEKESVRCCSTQKPSTAK